LFNEKIEGMDATEMKQYICGTFDGVTAVNGTGDTFLSYDPDGDLPADRWFPFATIVTGDRYDTVSDLDPAGRYRLNIGLPKATYLSLFGTPPAQLDYAAADVLMPHPVYGGQYWVCVVNPGESTREVVGELLAEAHRFAARKHANRLGRTAPA
jgi:hypothetical protein